MKLRTMKYCLKEGLINLYRYKLMSLASMSTIAASLLLFGIFIILAANLQSNSKVLSSQPEMQIYCQSEIDSSKALEIYEKISSNPLVEKADLIPKDEALKDVKKSFGEDAGLFDDLGNDFLPISFVIKLKNPEMSEQASEDFKKIDGIQKVNYPRERIYFIQSLIKWIKYFSGFMMFLLTIVSVLVIANTIRLAMFARRKEISIMKYIGSTDWFIRWPFIVEGLLIGIIGAGIGFLILMNLYSFVFNQYNEYFEDFFKLVEWQFISWRIIEVYVVIGIFVGVTGSIVSIRKYLKV